MYPKSLQDLIESFKNLPGVGQKTAERYALAMLDRDEAVVELFAQSLLDVKHNIKPCKVCGNYTENELCSICENVERNHKLVCVVESSKDVIAMEKTNEYNGVYHVLNGLISPTKGIMPDDINISSLMDRIDDIEEVIIATNPTLEGETTAMYLANLIKNKNVKVTRIAYGLQMGSHVDYVDELTLIRALEGRKEI